MQNYSIMKISSETQEEQRFEKARFTQKCESRYDYFISFLEFFGHKLDISAYIELWIAKNM